MIVTMMIHNSCHYDGETLGVTLMVTPLVLLWWCHPWCHYDGVTLGGTILVSPLVSL